MNKKLTQINHILIGVLVVTQLFIAMFQANIVRDVQFLGLSIFEGFNIILSFVCLGITVFVHSKKRVFVKYIPYVVVLGIYLVLHCYNTYQFDASVYAAQSPNFFTETYYIFRIFIVPIILLFNIYYSGIEKETLLQILEIFVFIAVVVMVVTNVLHLALQNYTNDAIYNSLSFFDWFSFESAEKYDYYHLTTKGWFLSGNQMAGILFMSFPVIIYRAYLKRSWFHYITVSLQILAMFMLGNKVSNLGSLLVVAMFGGFWIFFKVLKHKERGILVIAIIGLCFLVLVPFSPVGHMIRYQNKVKEMETAEVSKTLIEQAMEAEETEDYENLKEDSVFFSELDADQLSEEEQNFVIEYMDEYHLFFGISSFITKSYDEPECARFWVCYMKNVRTNDYRNLKSGILKDIYLRNQNQLDSYLGMGNTLNFLYTEEDYTYQIYSYGIAGFLVLIGPYFYLVLYVLVQGIKNFKKMFTLESAMYFSAPLLGLLVAKFSGHIFENTLPLMIISVVGGILLLHTRCQTVNAEE